MNEKAGIDFKKGEKAALYSSLINLLLAIIKAIIGVLSGSIALIADSIHSFSDIVASAVVYIGLKLSRRKPDEKFLYGYYKVESFASLIISVLIIVTGIEIALESYKAFLNPNVIEIPLISLSVAALSVFVSFLLARYKDKIGKEIDSQALINDGKHSFIDIFSSAIVFIGILSSYLGYLSLQGISGVLVAFLIMYIGLKLAKNDILVLLDAGVDPEVIEKITTIALSVENVEGIHNVKVRKSGPVLFAELHLETKKGLPVIDASETINHIKKAVKSKINNLDTLTVQTEPIKKEKLRVAVPLDDKNGMQSHISEHFARAPYFLIADVVNGKIISSIIKENPGIKLEKKKGIESAEFLGKESVDVLISNEINEGPRSVLSTKLIYTVAPKGRNLEETILDVYM